MRFPDGVRSARVRGASVLVVDQVISGASNLVVLLLAATKLGPKSFSSFALAQVLVLAAVTLQRSALMEPAMATQRSLGHGRLKAITLLCSIVLLCAGVAILQYVLNHDRTFCLVTVAVTAIALMQDFLRYQGINEHRQRRVLASDASWLVASAILVAVLPLRGSPDRAMIAWGVGAVVGLLLFVGMTAAAPGATFSFEDIWPLSRWSTLEGSLGTVNLLLPLVIGALALDQTNVGAYRIFQNLAGPFNVVHTTVTISLLRTSAQLGSRDAALRLISRVRAWSFQLAGLAAAYMFLASVAVVWVVASPADRHRYWIPALVVGASAVVNAYLSPKLAAMKSLARQRATVWPRAAVTLASIVLAVLIGTNVWQVSDGTGTIIAITAALSLFVWNAAYVSVVRKERGLVIDVPPNAVATEVDGTA
jgi:hypothetical protein